MIKFLLMCIKQYKESKDNVYGEDEIFFDYFSNLDQESRREYIKSYANFINYKYLISVISNEQDGISNQEFCIDNYMEIIHAPKPNIYVSGKTGIVTKVWSKERMQNAETFSSIRKGWRSHIDNKVEGAYIEEYDLLMVNVHNHRICKGLLTQKLKLCLYKNEGIKMKIIKNEFKNAEIKTKKKDEYLFCKMIQIDMHLKDIEKSSQDR